MLVAGCSIAISKTSMAIRLIGVTCYPLMCFVLPSLFYITLGVPKTWKHRVPYLFAWALLLLMTGFIVSGILDLMSSS